MSFVARAVVYNADKTLYYRQEHEWTSLSTTSQEALAEGLEKQRKFLEDMKIKQGSKLPDAVFHATLSATGQADISYSEFTFDMYQKAHHAWNMMLEELFRIQEKEIQAAQTPPSGTTPPGQGGTPPGQARPK